MRRIIKMLPCRRYWRLWSLTAIIAFGFFPESKVKIGVGVRGRLILPDTGAPKVSIGGVRGGLRPPQVGAPKARVGSGVRGNSEQQGKQL